MRPHMGFHTKIQKRHYTHSISSFCELSVRLTSPPCRSPQHLFPHITYCPEPLSATILSDKNVSKGGEYIMPRGERILSPLRNPFAEGTGACSISLHLRVSREGLCVPTCTLLCTRVYTLVYTCVHSCVLACILLCTRVYTPPLLPRGRRGSLRGAPLPLRGAKRRTIGGEEGGRIIILRGSWYLLRGRARGDSA